MRFYSKILLFILVAAMGFACSTASRKTLTPLETLKEYAEAFQKKDITAMKLLLSQETLKMHEQEAKAQNVTVDDIVRRETLFAENQKTYEFRNQKVEDTTATIEMKDSIGIWNTVHFVKEDGAWKIDRKGDSDKIQQEVEQKQNELDQIINQGRIDTANTGSANIGSANVSNVNIANVNIGNVNGGTNTNAGNANGGRDTNVNANTQP